MNFTIKRVKIIWTVIHENTLHFSIFIDKYLKDKCSWWQHTENNIFFMLLTVEAL